VRTTRYWNKPSPGDAQHLKIRKQNNVKKDYFGVIKAKYNNKYRYISLIKMKNQA